MITRKPLKLAPATATGKAASARTTDGSARSARTATGKATGSSGGKGGRNGTAPAATPHATPKVRVTFSLPDEGTPVSVVGDFNGWDPLAHPLRRRSNGTRSVAVDLDAGHTYAFRYLVDGGHFFDDPAADGYESNGYGSTHGVLSC